MEDKLEQLTEDITARKKQEEELLHSRKRYRDVIEFATDGIFESSADGKYIDVNPAGCNMLGYQKDEIIGRSALDFVADEDRDRLIQTLKNFYLKQDFQLVTEFSVKRKDGTTLVAEVSIKALPDGRRISFLRDLTSRKESEIALATSERRYRMLVEGAYDSILVADESGTIVLVNEQLGKKFGYTTEELLGKPIEFLLPERFRTRHVLNRQNYSKAASPRPMGVGLELYGRKKDGTEFPVDISLSPTQTQEGLQVTAIIRDITERKRHEDQQAFLSQIAKSLNEVLNYEDRAQVLAEGLIEKIADTCVLRVYEDGELVPKGVATRNSPKKSILLKSISEGAGRRGLFGYERVAQLKETVMVTDAKKLILNNPEVDPQLREIVEAMGITSYVSVPLTAMKSVIGTLTVSMSVSGRRFSPEDVTFIEIVANRSAVAIENARLYRQAQIANLVTENLPALIAYWDKDQRCRFANRVYKDWFGLTPDQMYGRTIEEILGKSLYEKNSVYIQGALAGRPQLFERDLVMHATGELRHTSALYLPEIIEGQVGGFFVMVTDITDLKRAQMSANLQKERAEAEVRLREEMLGIVSHDLRNPLALIDMTAQVLADEERSNPKTQKHAERIRNSAKSMQRMISDLLDFGRIQGGVFTVDREPVRVETVVDEAMESMSLRAHAKNIKIAIDICQNCPLIFADKRRVVQVLWNLIGNAIKFTPEGGRIELKITADADGVQFLVSDKGTGILKEDLPKIFDRFWQAKKTAALGSGLGLTIAKGIVDAHGGKIWAESKLENGSQFYFVIPRADRKSSINAEASMTFKKDPPSQKILNGIHILIVDDSAENLSLLRLMLERSGAQVTEALNAAEALLKLESGKPDIMITDIEMPDGSGYDLIEKIHKMINRNGWFPIAALTGHTSQSEMQKIAEAGFDACFSKPVSYQKLIASLSEMTHRSLH